MSTTSRPEQPEPLEFPPAETPLTPSSSGAADPPPPAASEKPPIRQATPGKPPVRVSPAQFPAEPQLPTDASSTEPVQANVLSSGPPPAVVTAMPEAENRPVAPPVTATARPHWLVRAWRAVSAAATWCYGVVALMLCLAFLATFPIIQFLSLGYLLEAAGRVARSGRLRDGFVDIDKAARVVSIVMGTWLMILPLRLISDFWYSSYVIDPLSPTTQTLWIVLIVSTVLMVLHILWAWARGGKLRHFFWPAPVRLVKRLIRGGKYVEARDAVWDFVVSLRLPHYFWLGLRGFAGAVAWLLVPVLLFIGATTLPPAAAGLSGLIGAPLFALVLLYLPFLQTNFAADQRLEAMFQVGRVRRQFQRAPIAFWFALLITLAFALPLYLLKIELTPREVALLPSLVFVCFIFPSRLITGWAVARGSRDRPPRFFLLNWFFRAAGVPLVAFYVFLVFFTRYTSWNGVWSLFEQHAFLVPVPFLGQ